MLRIVKPGTRRRAFAGGGCDAVGLPRYRAPILERPDGPALVKVERPLPLPDGYGWKDGAKSVGRTVVIGVAVLVVVLLLVGGW